jgi:hypothetical protein
MYPTEQVVPVKTTNSVKLGGSLKIKDVGVDAEAAHGTEVTQGTPWLRAFNELGPDPVWEFRRTDATAVDGEQRLVLVVRAPALIQTRGTMTLLVQVERKHLKVIPYTAKLPDSPSVTFYVPNTMNEHGS